MNKTTTIRDLNKMLVRGELPEELKEQLITVNTPPQINYNAEPITLTPYTVDQVPYGCLKNGNFSGFVVHISNKIKFKLFKKNLIVLNSLIKFL